MILVTCPREIPQILAEEIRALGFTVHAVLPAGVEVQAPYEACLDLNLHLRTAHRVLYRLGEWQCTTPDEMYEAVRSVLWEEWIPADGYLAVISSVKTPSIDNTQFANVRCKDAVVDRIRDKKGIRPDSGPRTDRSVVFLFWHDTTCMVYVDTSGGPLSNRGYRKHPGKAPLRESLAAAILLTTSWKGLGHVVNPMAGSGTLAIEAAMIARKIAPGTLHSEFGLLHLLPTDKKLWSRKRAEARSKEKSELPSDMQIIATDYDRSMVDHARENARGAGVVRDITFDACAFQETEVPEYIERSYGHDIVIFNPEYGLRLGNEEDLISTYFAIGDFFKQQCAGYVGYVFTGNSTLAKRVGLRSSRRIPFMTADMECRLLEYQLYK